MSRSRASRNSDRNSRHNDYGRSRSPRHRDSGTTVNLSREVTDVLQKDLSGFRKYHQNVQVHLEDTKLTLHGSNREKRDLLMSMYRCLSDKKQLHCVRLRDTATDLKLEGSEDENKQRASDLEEATKKIKTSDDKACKLELEEGEFKKEIENLKSRLRKAEEELEEQKNTNVSLTKMNEETMKQLKFQEEQTRMVTRIKQEKNQHQKCDWSNISKENNKKFKSLEEKYEGQKILLDSREREILILTRKIGSLVKKMKKQYPEYIEVSDEVD